MSSSIDKADLNDVPLEEEAPIKTTQPIEPNEAPSLGCGIMGKYPVISVLTFALVGIGAGIGLSFWEPDDMDKKDKLLKWVRAIVIVSVVSHHSIDRLDSLEPCSFERSSASSFH